MLPENLLLYQLVIQAAVVHSSVILDRHNMITGTRYQGTGTLHPDPEIKQNR